MLRLLAQREQGYGDIAALMGIGVDDVRSRVRESLDSLDGSPGADQRAMLRLLAQREEGYGDIAALMGIGVDDVRSRVRGALAALDGEPAPAAPKPPPATPERAAEAAPPKAPAPRPSAREGRASTSRGSRRVEAPKWLRLPEDRRARIGLLAVGVVVLVLVVLLVTGSFSGSSGSSGTSGAANAKKAPTQAVLKSVDGSGAVGQALFGRSGQSVVLLLSAKGLSPSPPGSSYTVSLSRGPGERLPLVATKVGKSGTIAGRFQVAPEVLGLLASGFDEMDVSLVGDRRLKVALAQARKTRKAPAYGGVETLRGTITGPIVEAGE